MDVETLTLANERSTISGEVDHLLLADFPDGLVDRLDIIGDTWNILDGAVVSDDHVLHVIVPESEVDEFAEEPGTNDLEFTSKDTTGINITVQNVRSLMGSCIFKVLTSCKVQSTH